MSSTPNALRAALFASRPKTWIAGASPVFLGASLAFRDGECRFDLFFFCLLFSLLIQIGTNFANDYFDWKNGADTPARIGPARAVVQGWLSPQTMKRLFFLFFSAAFFASLPLVEASGIWALGFVISSIAFGVLYTGGPRPLGYMGLGELLVALYFGPIAVLGTYFVQRHSIHLETAILSLSPGLLASAILIANNLRDEETDRSANKNTLVVRFGRTFGRIEYGLCLIFGASIPLLYGYFTPIPILALALPLLRRTIEYRSPSEIIMLLPKTALLFIVFTVLFSLESLG